MNNSRRFMSSTGFGCLLLFALPFAAVGAGMAIWMIVNLVDHVRMSQWVETPAKVLRADLRTHSDSEGGDTYEATAEYEYQYGGCKYVGRRVAIDGSADNVGSFHKNMHRQLSAHQKSGRRFRCFVNPSNPAESVLFRDIRWEMIGIKAIFALAFGTAGFGLLIFAAIGGRKHRAEKLRAAANPDQPWLWKAEWAGGKISSSTKTTVLFPLGFALFWNLLSTAAFWRTVISGEIFRVDKWIVWFGIICLLQIVGLGLMIWAIVSVIRWLKYGRSIFEMASVPGVIGGRLAGVVRASAKVRPEDGFQLKLSCVNCVQTSGSDSHISRNVLWQNEQVISRELAHNDPEQSAIPVLFQIPYECRPTDEANAGNQTIWRLEVSAKTPGPDYKAVFDVPVFKTPESDPNFAIDRGLISDYVAPDDPDRDLCKSGVRKTVSPFGDGCRLVFPMARAPGMAAMSTLAGLVFAAAPIVIYYLDAGFSFITVPIMAILGLVGLLLLAVSVDVWFYRSVVDASPHGMTIVGGVFGLGRRREIETSDIEKLVLKSRMSSGEGADKKIYYDIDVVCKSGGKVTAGKRILGKRLAESVIRRIEQAMGKEPASPEAKESDG